MNDPVTLATYGALALVPGLAWLYYFYRLDCYEPEPAALLARTFALGGLVVFPAFLIERTLLDLLVDQPMTYLGDLDRTTLAYAAFLVIAPVEETLKFAAAYASVANSPEYDEPMDGVVYAAAAALGFATVENVFYMATSGARVLIGRGLFSCLLHASATGVMGYAWSQLRFQGKPRSRLVIAWLGAVVAHGFFDLVAFGSERAAMLKLGIVLVVVDAALSARIARALQASPFRDEDEDEADAAA